MEKDILIVSAMAGGGHKSAMYSLGESLRRFAPELKTGYFESAVEDIENAHRVIYSKFQRLYDFFYDLMEQDWLRGAYFGFTQAMIAKFKAEMTPLVAERAAPLIVSTHFMQTYALLQLKAELRSDVKIVAYIPDFDESLIHVPRYKGLLPDAVIAQSPRYLAKLQRKYGYAEKQTVRAGYLPRAPFSEARPFSPETARAELRKHQLPSISALEPNRFTIVATGGAYWVEHLYEEFERLALREDFDWEHSQALIACGNNQRAFEKFSRLAERTGKLIIALPFLDAAQMALLFRSASATVLSGIAPATFYELLETDAGPISIYRINPGPEKFNLNVALELGLATYRPDRDDLLSFLSFLSRNPSAAAAAKAEFCQNARVERAAAQARAQAVAEFLETFLVSA